MRVSRTLRSDFGQKRFISGWSASMEASEILPLFFFSCSCCSLNAGCGAVSLSLAGEWLTLGTMGSASLL